VGIIGAAWFVSPHLSEPIVGLALGVIVGGVLQVALQVPWICGAGLKLFPVWKPLHPAVRRIGYLMLPAVFGSAVYQLNQFVGTLLASFLQEGSVSWLYYADRLVQFPLGIFAIAIATAVLPSLSVDAARKNHEQFQKTLEHGLCLVFFILLPAMAGYLVLGKPIVVLLFERGVFDPRSSMMTSEALICYTLGLWAFSGMRILIAGFYAVQDTKTPVKVAVISLGLNTLLSLVLMGPMKHSGLALSLSIASGFQFFLLAFLLRNKGLFIHVGKVLKSVSKSAAAAAIMGSVVFVCRAVMVRDARDVCVTQRICNLSILIAIGIIAYYAAASLFGCREKEAVLAMFGIKRDR
jgi:putative peptidoglycan lipid II flippase